jgi:hypothetical protein
VTRNKPPAASSSLLKRVVASRVHKSTPWKLHKWLPVPRAMPKMLKELEAAPQFRGQFFRARSMISGLYSK